MPAPQRTTRVRAPAAVADNEPYYTGIPKPGETGPRLARMSTTRPEAIARVRQLPTERELTCALAASSMSGLPAIGTTRGRSLRVAVPAKA